MMPSPYEHRTVRSIDDDIARQRIKAEHARQRAERRYDIDRQRIDRIAGLEKENQLLKNCLSEALLMGDEATMLAPGRGSIPLAEFVKEQWDMEPGDIA